MAHQSNKTSRHKAPQAADAITLQMLSQHKTPKLKPIKYREHDLCHTLT